MVGIDWSSPFYSTTFARRFTIGLVGWTWWHHTLQKSLFNGKILPQNGQIFPRAQSLITWCQRFFFSTTVDVSIICEASFYRSFPWKSDPSLMILMITGIMGGAPKKRNSLVCCRLCVESRTWIDKTETRSPSQTASDFTTVRNSSWKTYKPPDCCLSQELFIATNCNSSICWPSILWSIIQQSLHPRKLTCP